MSRPSFTGPSCMLGACVCVCGRVVGSACVGRVHVEINVKMRVFIWVSESLSKWVQLCVRVHTDSWTKGAWQVVDSFIFTLGPESDSTEEKGEKKKKKKNLGDIKMNGRRVEKHIMASPQRVTSTADLLLSCLHRCVYIHVCVCACVRLLPFILYPFSLSFPHFLSFSDYTPFSHKVSQSCVCVCMCVYLSKYAWECVCFHPRSVPSWTFFFFSFFFFFFFSSLQTMRCPSLLLSPASIHSPWWLFCVLAMRFVSTNKAVEGRRRKKRDRRMDVGWERREDDGKQKRWLKQKV